MAANDALAPEDTFRLREYLSVLRLRKWSIIILTLVALLSALAYASVQTRIYKSDARVEATNPLASIQQNPLVQPNMDTERQTVASTKVTKCAVAIQNRLTADELLAGTEAIRPDLERICASDALPGGTAPLGSKKKLNVSVLQNTNVLVISYSDPKPAAAQLGAMAFAEAYVFIKNADATAKIEGLRAPLVEQEQKLVEEQSKVGEQLADAAAAGAPIAAFQVRYNQISQQLASLQQQLLNLNPALINPPQVTTQAQLPTKPSSPNVPLIGAIGLFVGLAFGIGLALLRERLDDRLRGRADLEQALGAPVLAVIPQVPDWRKRQDTKLVTLDQPKSAVVEAYRTLRTSVLFAAAQRGIKTIMVCSPSAGEGKTTTAANLAVVLADTNKRVILVSADLRKPRVHRFFRLKNDAGLSSALSGEVKPWQALQDPKVENLRVMASGPVPARPAELLQSEQMGELLAELREVADFVIIDTAPVTLVADALALAPLVDGVLFVADAENTSRGAISHSREQMEQVGAPLLGSVLNNFDPAKARGYGYYGYGRYRYGYGRYGGAYGQAYGHTYGDGEAAREPVLGPQERPRF